MSFPFLPSVFIFRKWKTFPPVLILFFKDNVQRDDEQCKLLRRHLNSKVFPYPKVKTLGSFHNYYVSMQNLTTIDLELIAKVLYLDDFERKTIFKTVFIE